MTMPTCPVDTRAEQLGAIAKVCPLHSGRLLRSIALIPFAAPKFRGRA